MLLEAYEKYWQKQEKRDETRVSPVSKGAETEIVTSNLM